jgi:hypothetical protein
MANGYRSPQSLNQLPESSLSPVRNSGSNLPSGCPADHHVALRQCSTRIPVHSGSEIKLLSDPPTKRSAEDITFDYVDPEELRIYNDLARRIQKCFEKRESEKSKRRDRLSVKPLTSLMQE